MKDYQEVLYTFMHYTLGTQNILFESLALTVLTQGIPVFDHLQHAAKTEGENSLRMRLLSLV